MVCTCSATLQLDIADDYGTAAWLMVTRFSDAHINCGYITPLVKDKPETTKRYEVNPRTEDHKKEI